MDSKSLSERLYKLLYISYCLPGEMWVNFFRDFLFGNIGHPNLHSHNLKTGTVQAKPEK